MVIAPHRTVKTAAVSTGRGTVTRERDVEPGETPPAEPPSTAE
jgi:hypothetical protein